MTTKVNSEASYKEAILQTMSEITDLLQKSGAMPLAKDDEEGGEVDSPVAQAESEATEAPVADAPAPGPDASGEASTGADEQAAEDAISDLGEADGEGDDGMDGRAEVEQMVADMSDDELILMLECLEAEHASRGAGEPEQDAGDASIEPDMETAEDTLDAPEGDVGQDGDMVAPETEEEAAPAAPESEEKPEEFGKSDDMDAMEMSKSGGTHQTWKTEKDQHGKVTANAKGEGTSFAGAQIRGAKMAKENGQMKAHAARTESAKTEHKKNLAELKGMKKPDLGKSEEKDDDKDELKKSIQLLTEYVTALEAKFAAPAPKAAPVVVTKPLASSRPVGQALEKSAPAPKVTKLAKSDGVKLLMDTLRKEQNLSPAHKTVTSGMVGDLDRAQGEKADQMIQAFQEAGILPK